MTNAPWHEITWLSRVRSWIEQELARRSDSLRGEMELVKRWEAACVLRVPTQSHGTLYFKACRKPTVLLANEVALTHLLAELYPHELPSFFALNKKNGWMLMQDAGIPLTNFPLVSWEQALRVYSRLQQKSSFEIEKLLCSVPDRRIETLLISFERCCLSQQKLWSFFSPSEKVQIRHLVPQLQNICTQLEKYHVPSTTLIHGDLLPQNIMIMGIDQVTFVDWSDGGISHPFCDAARFLSSSALYPHPDFQKMLRSTYLASWLQYESKALLEEILMRAGILNRIHLALSFQQCLWNQAMLDNFLFEVRMLLHMVNKHNDS